MSSRVGSKASGQPIPDPSKTKWAVWIPIWLAVAGCVGSAIPWCYDHLWPDRRALEGSSTQLSNVPLAAKSEFDHAAHEIYSPGTYLGKGTEVPFPFHRKGHGDETFGFISSSDAKVTFKVLGTYSEARLLAPVLFTGSGATVNTGENGIEEADRISSWPDIDPLKPSKSSMEIANNAVAGRTWEVTYQLHRGIHYSLRIEPYAGGLEGPPWPTYTYDLSMTLERD